MSGKSSAIDPTSLTVAELKDELSKNQIPFVGKKVKQYYVDLYRQNVQTTVLPTSFSSDEDEDPGQSKVNERNFFREMLSNYAPDVILNRGC